MLISFLKCDQRCEDKTYSRWEFVGKNSEKKKSVFTSQLKSVKGHPDLTPFLLQPTLLHSHSCLGKGPVVLRGTLATASCVRNYCLKKSTWCSWRNHGHAISVGGMPHHLGANTPHVFVTSIPRRCCDSCSAQHECIFPKMQTQAGYKYTHTVCARVCVCKCTHRHIPTHAHIYAKRGPFANCPKWNKTYRM
jgi:hypothetical protein